MKYVPLTRLILPIQRIWILSLLAIQASTTGASPGLETSHFRNLQSEPDAVSVITDTGTYQLKPAAKGLWAKDLVKTRFSLNGTGLSIEVAAPKEPLKWLQIQWKASLPSDWKYLGDAWERAYGDLQWGPLDAKRVMPWYFLASDGALTHGYGVKTGPSALCYWSADESGITLHADVRCGGMGVRLGERKLQVCTMVSRCGKSNETPFAAARAFCQLMCPHPRLPKQPVYGFNDWYCTYGHDTADQFIANVAWLLSLAPKNGNPPFAVVDDGWQWNGENGQSPGLWNQTRPHFSRTLTMAELAKKVAALGARPGLWYRPLLANAGQPMNWRLQRDASILDPTVPEVRALLRETMARFRGWGFQLIKHDYSTVDICGKWGNKMGAAVTDDGWAFADRSKTTAEVIRDFYSDLRAAAGGQTLILGCNTMGHLAAGFFEIQRIGDDTSGQEWARTRRMGVNCLALRAPQHGTFFAVDADCAGQTSSNSMPWEKNSQWLDLLAHSGTPLFISFPHETVNPEQEAALRAALIAASKRQPLAEPLDWQTQRVPARWLLDKKEVTFSW
jgi:alpha-galactosidase